MDPTSSRAGTLPYPTQVFEDSVRVTGRCLITGLGGACVALGVIGHFVQLWPTTCFLLGADACFGRTAPRCRRWLHRNRLVGVSLRRYRAQQGAGGRIKWWTLTYLWGGLALTAAWTATPWSLLFLLASIGTAVIAHLFSIPTPPAEHGNDSDPFAA